MKRALTWSYGGGTQSVAIAVLIAQKRLPLPECIVMADTGKEMTKTWDYLREYVQPLLATVGAAVEIAPHTLSKVGLYGKNGDILMPLYTENGALPTLCSTEWKKRVVQRYLRQKGYGPENPVTTWIGVSLDEIGRAKPSGVQWQEYDWPLLDMKGVLGGAFRRNECYNVVEDAGLPRPPKSACYDCPFKSNADYREQRDYYPQDHEKAIANDNLLRQYDISRGNSGVYIHRSGVPLAEANLEEDNEGNTVFARELTCESGHCWT